MPHFLRDHHALCRAIVYLLVIAIPFGVAVHKGAGSLAVLALLYWHYRERPTLQYLRPFIPHMVLAALLVAAIIVGGLVNPAGAPDALGFFSGYLEFVLGPVLLAPVLARLFGDNYDRLWRLFATICIIWGLVALSQYFFAWKIKGSSLASTIHRAQGFYSHPLTLAYVASLLWPLALGRLVAQPKHWPQAASLGGLGLIVISSLSRVIQLLALGLGFWTAWQSMRGRWRVLSVGLGAVAVLVVALTPNPVSKRFHDTFSKQLFASDGGYIFDRAVFWHAHWEMIKDRPVLGHGPHVTPEYRQPYYAKIGLPDFEKTYAAHNNFLEVFMSGGVLAIICFALWLMWMLAVIAWRGPPGVMRLVALQTWVVFVLGGLMQNSLFDSEVRYVLTLLLGLYFSFVLLDQGLIDQQAES